MLIFLIHIEILLTSIAIGASLCALLFGVSSSLNMAVATIVASGLLNPNLGVLQTFTGELVSKEQQGAIFLSRNAEIEIY